MADDIATLRRILRTSTARSPSSACRPNWYRPSYFAAKYMQEHGYRVIPVNPRYAEILGERCYPTLAAIADPGRHRRRASARTRGRDADRRARRSRSAPRCLWHADRRQATTTPPRIAADAGLDVVMDRCVKIEHARLFGGLNWAGVNTGVISARRPRLIRCRTRTDCSAHGRPQSSSSTRCASTPARSPTRRPARARCRSTRRRSSSSTAPTTRRACSTCRPSATSTRGSRNPTVAALEERVAALEGGRAALAVGERHGGARRWRC